MDTVKLEAKWPPDRRRCTIDASEFGIYKEPDDGKRRPRGADRATGCLLVVSLLAAAAVAVYFMFFDYTIPATQAAASTGGPIVSYAKYVQSKQSTAAAGHTDGFLSAMLAVKNSENFTSTADDGPQRTDDDDDRPAAVGARHARVYQRTPPRRSAYAAYGPDYDYWRTAEDATAGRDGRLEYSDGIYGFNRRSDFPQLAAYRAPFPPKSVVDVMKYVTGRPPRRKPSRTPAPQRPPAHHPPPQPPPTQPPPPPPRDDFMVAQESSLRYVPIQPAEEVNRFLPDAVAPAKGNSKRFRNKFGPPVYLTPPRAALPDDFMKPPERDAGYSTSFTGVVPASDVATAQHPDASSAGSVLQSYTDVVYRTPVSTTRYAVPDSPAPPPSPTKKAKKNRYKGNKKPISVMLDIYPMPDGRENERDQESEEEEEEEEENDEENTSPDIRTSLKSNLQQSDVDDLLYRLKLLSKLNEGGRRLTKSLKKSEEQDVQTPTIHLTTENSLKDEEEKDSDETIRWPTFDFAQESKIITNTLKNIKKHS